MTTLKERVSSSQEVNQSTQRILVVDDENSISELIATSLKFVGFDVRTAANGAQALQIAEEFKPHALILDVMLPDQNGFEVCRQLRSEGHNVGVLFLTAKDSVEDKIAGLTIGGDDYVTKPFGLEELVLRVRAILRRSQFTVQTTSSLTCGPITLDSDSHQVTFNDEVIDLSPTEFRLLHVLLESKGRVLSKTYLLDEVWGITFESESTVVDTYISYLRKKLHRDGFEGIRTVRGVGFQLQAEKK